MGSTVRPLPACPPAAPARLYEYFRIAIEDPTINWVDLGATRRQAKTGIGCDGGRRRGRGEWRVEGCLLPAGWPAI